MSSSTRTKALKLATDQVTKLTEDVENASKRLLADQKRCSELQSRRVEDLRALIDADDTDFRSMLDKLTAQKLDELKAFKIRVSAFEERIAEIRKKTTAASLTFDRRTIELVDSLIADVTDAVGNPDHILDISVVFDEERLSRIITDIYKVMYVNESSERTLFPRSYLSRNMSTKSVHLALIVHSSKDGELPSTIRGLFAGDPTRQWFPLKVHATERTPIMQNSGVCGIDDMQLVFVGGNRAKSRQLVDDVYRLTFDPHTRAFEKSRLPSLPICVQSVCVTADRTGSLYVFGGLVHSNLSLGNTYQHSKRAFSMDMKSSQWRELPTMPRFLHRASAILYNNTIVVSGYGEDKLLASLVYDISMNEWLSGSIDFPGELEEFQEFRPIVVRGVLLIVAFRHECVKGSTLTVFSLLRDGRWHSAPIKTSFPLKSCQVVRQGGLIAVYSEYPDRFFTIDPVLCTLSDPTCQPEIDTIFDSRFGDSFDGEASTYIVSL